ncbi:N-acetylglucosamine kinase [Desertivirga brevis]|uniref:N-acetylglucosamine kinase n=1 Tax=Desertivirga brevis TaxID=2810310 RepID=UPI001A96A4C6|nr:N-acetylglucosamine kinase [Pedobacter sp. SYSU D00873]
MILIADGGSTKTHWSLISKDLNTKDFYSEGYNPYFVDEEYIVSSLQDVLPEDLVTENVEKIYFYGAGVHNKEKAAVLERAFGRIFTKASTFIEHDLLAACRALLNQDAGFAAILGTGTNTAIYDGNKISYHIDSAAYILGDEGSGCYIGKKFLTDLVRGTLPDTIKESFNGAYTYTIDEILDRIYTKPLVSRFCASFCEFIAKHIDNEHIYKLVESSFNDFFSNLVSLYPDYQKYEFNSVGSVGFYFKDILASVADRHGMKTGKILKSPIEGLIIYHKQLLLTNTEVVS